MLNRDIIFKLYKKMDTIKSYINNGIIINYNAEDEKEINAANEAINVASQKFTAVIHELTNVYSSNQQNAGMVNPSQQFTAVNNMFAGIDENIKFLYISISMSEAADEMYTALNRYLSAILKAIYNTIKNNQKAATPTSVVNPTENIGESKIKNKGKLKNISELNSIPNPEEGDTYTIEATGQTVQRINGEWAPILVYDSSSMMPGLDDLVSKMFADEAQRMPQQPQSIPHPVQYQPPMQPMYQPAMQQPQMQPMYQPAMQQPQMQPQPPVQPQPVVQSQSPLEPNGTFIPQIINPANLKSDPMKEPFEYNFMSEEDKERNETFNTLNNLLAGNINPPPQPQYYPPQNTHIQPAPVYQPMPQTYYGGYYQQPMYYQPPMQPMYQTAPQGPTQTLNQFDMNYLADRTAMREHGMNPGSAGTPQMVDVNQMINALNDSIGFKQ